MLAFITQVGTREYNQQVSSWTCDVCSHRIIGCYFIFVQLTVRDNRSITWLFNSVDSEQTCLAAKDCL